MLFWEKYTDMRKINMIWRVFSALKILYEATLPMYFYELFKLKSYSRGVHSNFDLKPVFM